MNRLATTVSVLIAFVALNFIFNIMPADAQAARGQGATQSIAKARKLILQLQSWSLEDESPPEGQFRALQKEVSRSVAELQQEGRIKDAKTLALWNKSVSSKHFSRESIPYLAAVSDMVIATTNQKEHKAQLSEFNSLFDKMATTNLGQQAKEIKNSQQSALTVKAHFENASPDKTKKPESIEQVKPTSSQAELMKKQVMESQQLMKKMFGSK